MKKLFLMISLASAVAFANAQDMTSKKGNPILHEAGDWAIGFDAVPILKTMGNVFQPNGGSGPYSQEDFTLVGLYVKEVHTAYRMKARIGFGSSSQEGAVTDSSTTPTKVETSNGFKLTLGAGIQKSRGGGRLHGIYGAEVAFGLGGGGSTESTYSQPLPTVAMSHVTKNESGSTMDIGLNGFIGAEYFFAPKMSVSAEYGWGLVMSSTGEGEVTTTTWDGAGVATATTTKGQKSSSMSIDVINATSIVLRCYF